MQVNPVSAIRPLRIRQKPVATSSQDSTSAASIWPGEIATLPAHIASAALNRTAHHDAHSQYATQLLASRSAADETRLERQQHLAQYESVADNERNFHSWSVSV
ncbi:hypothetical protein [Labrenzia sp. OB1]|uniref:hypothetical protein n=1 Tax=Labrenzia sp. OB1 TaxID=1561204 RepID=UPI0007B180DF|nr:hypothetical protein [Labrenzia sp. OB1]KZM51088.1 hypothetical protein OA90_05280 [Labrenzia sp. OB1]